MTDFSALTESFAKDLGFAEVFFLPPEKSAVQVDGLECDIPVHYPEYSCLCLLVYAYLPHKADEYVPAYYIASNKSYHAFRELIKKLNDAGIEAQKIHVPVKSTAERARIGMQGRNTLLHMEKYGSRVVLHTMLLKGVQPKEYDVLPRDLCKNCRLCQRACPTDAITEKGYHRERCIRNYMEDPPYPNFVRENIKMYLGCDECMRACPYNAHLPFADVPQEYRDILDPERIISGDVKAAKALLGQNVSTGRLKADAEAILGNGQAPRTLKTT